MLEPNNWKTITYLIPPIKCLTINIIETTLQLKLDLDASADRHLIITQRERNMKIRMHKKFCSSCPVNMSNLERFLDKKAMLVMNVRIVR